MEASIKKTQAKGSENPFLIPPKPKKGKGKLIFILILIILIAAVVAAVVLNLFGLKDKLIYALISQEPQYAAAYQQLELGQSELKEKQEQLEEDQKELESTRASLDKRKEQLDEQQKEIDEQKNSGDGADGTGGDVTTGGTVEGEVTADGYSQLAEIYESMDAQSAATRLVAMKDNEEVAKILKKMKSKKAGEILAQMSSGTAAAISKLMMK